MKNSGIDWIGQIPADWELRKIKYILRERNEKNEPIKSNNILSLTASQGVIPHSEKEGGGNKPKEDLSAYKLAYPDDIVMNSMNILSGSVGLSKYFGCVSPVYYMLYSDDENVNIKYYNYIFQTTVFQKSLMGLGNGIMMKETEDGKLNTIRMRIPLEKLNGLLLPIPSKEEQEKIVSKLECVIPEIDKMIAETKSSIENYKEYKQSVITEAVTKGLNKDVQMKDSGIEWIGEIPADWNITKYGRCATVKSNLVPPEEYPDYPQISPDNIEKGSGKLLNTYTTVAETGVISNNHLFFEGQIIYSKIRPLLNKVMIATFSGLCSADMYPIETTQHTKFLLYLMLSNYFITQVALVTEDRVKMPKINQEELSNIIVVLPSLGEQKEIADFLDSKIVEIDNIISEKEALVSNLEEYKKSLIYEYVTGKKLVL